LYCTIYAVKRRGGRGGEEDKMRTKQKRPCPFLDEF
jgi:hypothetical protein